MLKLTHRRSTPLHGQTISKVAISMETEDSRKPEPSDTLGIKALVYEVPFSQSAAWRSAVHQTALPCPDESSPLQPSHGTDGGVEVSDDLLQMIEKNLARNLVLNRPRCPKSRMRKKGSRLGCARTLES
jgi:hypothetical protein